MTRVMTVGSPRSVATSARVARSSSVFDNRSVSDPSVLPVSTVVTVYGADWCGDCRRTKRWLDSTDLAWTWIDRDADPAVRAMLADAGYLAIPVVVLPDGSVLVEPSDETLARALRPGAEATDEGR
jgi:mycoredoxin